MSVLVLTLNLVYVQSNWGIRPALIMETTYMLGTVSGVPVHITYSSGTKESSWMKLIEHPIYNPRSFTVAVR